MAVYGGIQAHEVERWLNALTNAAYDRRCPLSKVHGGNARARTARQDLLYLATSFRGGERSREAVADGLSRWCQHYLSEAEWYVLVGGRQPRSSRVTHTAPLAGQPRDALAGSEPATLSVDNASGEDTVVDDALDALYQHRVG
ncbi:hypothetical protein [Vreelandella stevensii]|uniref:hypothetical protein n=1 Tax=Vreelandella stevensii TaxID=502821 RepID=UPI00403AC185